ncbi:hypothetical protein Ancab_019683 [Ancistrocladus abbreviatus]
MKDKFKMARNIEHGVDNLEIVDIGIKHVEIMDIGIGGDNGENRVISKSQPKDDGASLVDINVTYFEGVSANSNTSVDVSYNTLDSDESCHRDEITNKALWSDNEEVFEQQQSPKRRRKGIEKSQQQPTGFGVTDNDDGNLQFHERSQIFDLDGHLVGDSVPSLPMPSTTCMSTHRSMLMPTPGREPILFAEAAPRPIPPQSLSTPHLTGQPRIISSQSLQAHKDAKKSEIARREKLVPWRPCN